MPIDDPDDTDQGHAPDTKPSGGGAPDLGEDADADEDGLNRNDYADAYGQDHPGMLEAMSTDTIDRDPAYLADVMHEGYSGRGAEPPEPFEVPEPGKDPVGAVAEFADEMGNWTDKTNQLQETFEQIEVELDEHGNVNVVDEADATAETDAHTEIPDHHDTPGVTDPGGLGATLFFGGAALGARAAVDAAVSTGHRIKDWFGRDG